MLKLISSPTWLPYPVTFWQEKGNDRKGRKQAGKAPRKGYSRAKGSPRYEPVWPCRTAWNSSRLAFKDWKWPRRTSLLPTGRNSGNPRLSRLRPFSEHRGNPNGYLRRHCGVDRFPSGGKTENRVWSCFSSCLCAKAIKVLLWVKY